VSKVVQEPPERVLSTLNKDGSRFRIRPRLSKGRFYYRRAAVAYFLIAAFALIPYFKMNGKPLMLLDLARREFSFFGATFLPTDSVLLMLLGLTIVITVFLVTALWGRVWCGWACPQTVYMEFLFRPIERLFEGNPNAQRKIDKEGWNWRRVAKNVVFLLLAMFAAHTFLAYFVGIDQLVAWVQASPAQHPYAFLLMAAVTGLMFFDFAYFREQMCIVTCPYGRLQSVLLDKRSLIVGYDSKRGEPRGKLKKGGPATGDCIDCGACVYTCPTGIDIRAGLQMECIGCTQCIDACDAIMDRIEKPRGLIRYSTQEELEGAGRKLLRPRVLAYPLILAGVFGTFVYLLGHRVDAQITILRPSGTPYTLLEDKVSNPVRLRIINRTGEDREYTVTLHAPGSEELIAPQNPFPVRAGGKGEMPMFIMSSPTSFPGGRKPIELEISDGHDFKETLEHQLLGPEGQP